MKPNPMIESSRRLYAGFLTLYPRDFRDEYGNSMRQLFADQCRSAARANGTRGLVSLWLRTILDLASSLLREHLASPRASLGLLESVPGEPLPWKGVALVLIPGIVFLVGQIGQLTGEDWFFLVFHRAAYYLIVPVLLVWLYKRRFPIWGLIPLGILYRTLIDAANRAEYILDFNLNKIYVSPASWIAAVYTKFPAVMKIIADTRIFLKTHAENIETIVAAVLVAGIALLFLRITRRSQFPRAAVAWTATFVLIALSEILSGLVTYLTDYRWTLMQLLQQKSLAGIMKDVLYSAYYFFTYDFGFLALILVGAIAARRHGRLALLLPLGYLIPTVLLGRFDDDPRMPYLVVAASAAVLAYRIFISFIAPLWIVRSASDRAQTRAGTIGLLAAVGFVAGVQIAYELAVGAVLGWGLSWNGLYYTISPDLIALAGIGIALSLYRKDVPAQKEAMLHPTPAET
jgi:hypothetical protein